nr:RecName: Full=Muscarinic toxin Mlalpha; Short=MT-Mlalpha [Micrurus lemniscatus]
LICFICFSPTAH